MKDQTVLQALQPQVLLLQELRQRSLLEDLREPALLHHLLPLAPSQKSLKEVQMHRCWPHQLLVLRSWVVAGCQTSHLLLWTP
jgi:hypothetical protein